MADKSNPEQESEAIQILSEEPLEVLDYLVERSKKVRLDIVINELNERKKLPGAVSIEGPSQFAKSMLRKRESREGLYKKAIQHKQRDLKSEPTPELGLIESPNEPEAAAVQSGGNDADSSAGRWQAIEILS